MLWALVALQIWVADESEKVRPDARPPAAAQAPRIRIAAAGGECVGAQLVVRGPALGLRAVAAGKAQLDLYRVGTVFLEHPSGPEGAAGEWPDALIPVLDPIYGEPRKAFPVDVAEGRAQAVFVEACPPRGTGASRLAGSVRLSWRGGSAEVPVEVRVRAFDLPATPALATAFGFSGYSAAKGHRRGVELARELTRAYDLAALRRGITLFGGTQDPPSFSKSDDGVRIDWTSYDQEVGPFLDGTALPGGARWTAVELREPGKLTRAQRRSYRRQWQEHFRQRGWLDRLFRYVQDEPSPDSFAEVEERAREMREDAPDVRRLVTTSWTDTLPDVDLWTPLLNCVGEKNPTCPRAVPRAKYSRLWWYQSCMSHGCSSDGKPVLDPAFRGWPSYMIDAPATAARAMGTLAFANDVSGELYFDTVFAYHETDPWQSQWAFGGNGDGTLFYPGTPDRIGGQRDVPVESLRLVQVSRSLADHAYLAICAQLGDPALARGEARAVAPSLRGFSRDPKAYARMRETLAARIEALMSARKLGARLIHDRRGRSLIDMQTMFAMLIAASLCPPQQVPPAKLAPGEVLTFKLDVVGADVGTFEVRTEHPPSVEKRAAILLSARAKTNAFMATNVGRYDFYATSLIMADFGPLRYREDTDENEVHRGIELAFPPQEGKLAVQATKNGDPEPFSVDAGAESRDLISTLYLLRFLPPDQPVCLEVYAARKMWKVTGKMAAKETIDTPIGRFSTLRFEGEALRTDDPKVKRPALMWVTDDARRFPLVGIAEVRGKTIRAQLISAPGMRRAARR